MTNARVQCPLAIANGIDNNIATISFFKDMILIGISNRFASSINGSEVMGFEIEENGEETTRSHLRKVSI